MIMEIIPYLIGIFFAIIGAIAYIVFWEEYEPKRALRHITLAIIAGFVYTLMRESYGYPDFVVTIIVGWFAPDFIQSIAERFKPKTSEKGEGNKGMMGQKQRSNASQAWATSLGETPSSPSKKVVK